MNVRIGGKGAAAATLVLGGAGIVAAQAPASASTVTATYSCNVPAVGTETVTINGSLTRDPESRHNRLTGQVQPGRQQHVPVLPADHQLVERHSGLDGQFESPGARGRHYALSNSASLSPYDPAIRNESCI
jgi:hypothetical protein